jgi:hypothetical protein
MRCTDRNMMFLGRWCGEKGQEESANDYSPVGVQPIIAAAK